MESAYVNFKDFLLVCRLLLGYFWITSGLLLGFFWTTSGLHLGYFWATSGLIVGYFWATSGLLAPRTKVLLRQPIVSKLFKRFFVFCGAVYVCYTASHIRSISNNREDCVGKLSIWTD